MERHPAINVTWFGAAAFCNWKSRQAGLTPCYEVDTNGIWRLTGKNGYRLPTESEWEFAATWDGNKKRIYAFGDEWNPARANTVDTAYEKATDDSPKTVPVFAHGPQDPAQDGSSPSGMLNMTGNVWEWCEDWYSKYPKFPADNPSGPETGSVKVVRGGSFRTEQSEAWCAYRGIADPSLSIPDLGFRTVH